MADIKPFGKALFLREEELRRGIELMYFAYRDFTGEADSILAEQDMGRAHHRAIYFVGRHPGMRVSDLLAILNITKQSLSRVLSTLVKDGYIIQKTGAGDRRPRYSDTVPPAPPDESSCRVFTGLAPSLSNLDRSIMAELK